MVTIARIAPRRVSRYLVHEAFAQGGMATVHLGLLQGPAGFSRVVAVKRLLDTYAGDVELRTMFFDEARLASRIHHPNVVTTLDVVSEDQELYVVMEYVHGLSLSQALRASAAGVPCDVAVGIAVEMLAGLHAAHEAKDPSGRSLELVHRDVSPQNVLVGADGISRVLDFGVARAAWRLRDTNDGRLRGKLRYMAPEQLAWRPLDRRADVFAAATVIWELLVGQPLFSAAPEPGDYRLGGGRVEPPSAHGARVPRELDEIVLRGLAVEPDDRYATAREMADDLASVVVPARAPRIEAWVREVGADVLASRAALVADVEREALAPMSASAITDGRALADVEKRAAERRVAAELPTEVPTLAEKTFAPSVTAEPSAPAASRPVWRRRMAALGLLTLALIGSAAMMLATWSPSKSARVEPAEAESAPSARTLPTEAASGALTPVVSSPTVLAAPPPTTPPVVSITPSSPTRPAGPARPGTASKPARKTADCRPSYIIDAAGVKHFKPECFDK